jgi:hypothetical protein
LRKTFHPERLSREKVHKKNQFMVDLMPLDQAHMGKRCLTYAQKVSLMCMHKRCLVHALTRGV